MKFLITVLSCHTHILDALLFDFREIRINFHFSAPYTLNCLNRNLTLLFVLSHVYDIQLNFICDSCVELGNNKIWRKCFERQTHEINNFSKSETRYTCFPKYSNKILIKHKINLIIQMSSIHKHTQELVKINMHEFDIRWDDKHPPPIAKIFNRK